ncbi:aminotransferase [Afifella sp. IM 167]|uniref:aminotransferase n=1 Tax=Afifella sp. IM 167 TaxID=2033586 RepID=UPI001CC924A2|nr:aminotransferase [Afifella sp. IM 167]MBZ8135396.1 aminotransferase [Afifella sp. IM 167]
MVNSVFGSVGTTIFETMSVMANEAGSINLGQGFPEALEPPEVVEAAVAALRAGPHQYPPMPGLPALRQAVADNQRRLIGLEVDWEREVLVTSGATEALADCFFGLLEPGDEVLVFEPAYDSYAPIIRRAGAVPVPIRVTPPDWRLPFQEIEDAIGQKTRAMVVNTPWNPVGRILSEEELAFLGEKMLRHDLIAICDEVYEHLTFDGRPHRTLFARPELRERVVRIGSAGKTFSVTGWKVGYITADARLMKPLLRAHQFMTFTTPPALQAAVAYGLSLPDSYFDGLRVEMQARRDLLVDGLREAGFDVPDVEATYFAIAATGDPEGDDFEFCRRLTFEAGVTAVPLSAFYGKGDMRSHIRFCFAKREETIRAAVERLGEWKASGMRRAAAG